MPPDVLAPARLGPVQLRNRVIKAASFEGRTPEGLVPMDWSTSTSRSPAAGSG